MPATTTRKIVHDGIAAWFGGTYQPAFRCWQNGALVSSGLGTVRKAFPKEINDNDFTAGMAAGRNMGAFMVVDIPSDKENREAIAGAPVVDGGGNITAGGIKVVESKVNLEVFHMSQVDYTEDAVDDVDQLVEAIKQRIRIDRTLGGICTQAGESRFESRRLSAGPALTKTGAQASGFKFSSRS